MTGAGSPGGPGIMNALLKVPDFELYIADKDTMAAGRALLPQRFFQIPEANAPAFTDTILQLCKAQNINVVLPLVTLELFRFAQAKTAFADAGIHVVVSDSRELEIANNKAALMGALQQNSIAVPAFHKAQTWQEVADAVFKLGYPQIPVCIKPSVSNGSRGFRILDANTDRYDLLLNAKPNNTYTTLGELELILKNHDFPELLVMEYLPGEEYTVDCLVVEGEIKAILPRQRILMNNGISVKGRFVKNDEIIAYCKQILGSLNLEGPVGIQVKMDSQGTFKILEINPRLQGTTTAAMGLGINLPAMAVWAALGQKDRLQLPEIAWGLTFARYYTEVFFPN